MVDESYYLVIPNLISVAWILINWIQKPKGTGEFISTVTPEYSYRFTTKLYRVLSLIATIDYILSKYLLITLSIVVKVGTDYQSIIDTIWDSNDLIGIAHLLYRIAREIKTIIKNGI